MENIPSVEINKAQMNTIKFDVSEDNEIEELTSGYNTQLNLTENSDSNKTFQNSSKTEFDFQGKRLCLNMSIYSNLIFIIISQNGKLGSFYIGEKEAEEESNNLFNYENEDDLETNNMGINIQCILGNRKDEANSFLCSNLIKGLFNLINEKLEKIEKIMISTAIKFDDVLLMNEKDKLAMTQSDYDYDNIILNPSFKALNNMLMTNLSELIAKIV